MIVGFRAFDAGMGTGADIAIAGAAEKNNGGDSWDFWENWDFWGIDEPAATAGQSWWDWLGYGWVMEWLTGFGV